MFNNIIYIATRDPKESSQFTVIAKSSRDFLSDRERQGYESVIKNAEKEVGAGGNPRMLKIFKKELEEFNLRHDTFKKALAEGSLPFPLSIEDGKVCSHASFYDFTSYANLKNYVNCEDPTELLFVIEYSDGETFNRIGFIETDNSFYDIKNYTSLIYLAINNEKGNNIMWKVNKNELTEDETFTLLESTQLEDCYFERPERDCVIKPLMSY